LASREGVQREDRLEEASCAGFMRPLRAACRLFRRTAGGFLRDGKWGFRGSVAPGSPGVFPLVEFRAGLVVWRMCRELVLTAAELLPPPSPAAPVPPEASFADSRGVGPPYPG
jgi:hypothetical protein